MLKNYLKEKRELIDGSIKNYLDELKYPQVIAEGMKYAVLNGGKRLRPILLLMTLELLGEREEKGIPAAVAIEMIHSYSLVHDDLPALDDDDYRRGKLTTHKKYGEAQGILIGDALLTHAFNVLTSKGQNIEAEKIVDIVRLTSQYAGIKGMIGGQMVDIESEGKNIDLPVLQYIHTHKTGKMISLPVEVACIISGVEEEKKEKLIEYSELIGLAFQIKDDILDIEGDFEKIGKPVGSDKELEKSTYPSIFGMEKTKEMLAEKIEAAKNIIHSEFESDKGKLFIELADYIQDREK
ncbi:farnesyl diphosphate synthase [uncultured Ilyobacter sp.]|uniref:polyprenyl synthetase family protein n=1 Tax=uncultured Ilyobacter sp. TaxID=544433 RepID=UPI002AA69E2D|nr:farnesyl diphosphate synthase [uncultured Ilyobacter sp.]